MLVRELTLVIDVSADEGELPHEHRDDLKEVAAELLGVPLSALPEGVDIELKRTGGDHAHPHPHPALPSDGAAAPDKVKA